MNRLSVWSPIWVALGVACAFSLALAGCGGPSVPPPTDGAAEPPTDQPLTDSVTSTVPDAPPTVSPLNADDPPDAGVAAQLTGFTPQFIVSMPWCDPHLHGEPVPRIGAPPDVGVGESTSICLFGFDTAQPISMTVRTAFAVRDIARRRVATGDSVAGTTLEPGSDLWLWAIWPGTPVANYVVTATQGDNSAQATVGVHPPTEPHVVVRPAAGPPGTVFTVGVTGFEADSSLSLYLYRRSEPVCADGSHCWLYKTRLSPIAVDAQGEGTLDLATAADDPTGVYLVRADVPNGASDKFTVE